jgi:cysteine desulfurase/selenocysteine lyase
MYDVQKIRSEFPILSRQVNGKPLTYLDNGASAQKPQVVIDAVTRGYAEEYANVHRGLHYLSNLATEKYEGVRGTIARFLNAASEDEIIMNTGTTEGINMVAYGWAMPHLQPGDEIVLSVMEHHANIVPWHFLRERQGVVLKWVDVDARGDLDPQKVIDAIGPKTKLVAITHMSKPSFRPPMNAVRPYWWMAVRQPCICQSTFRISAQISMRSRAINCTDHRRLVRSM